MPLIGIQRSLHLSTVIPETKSFLFKKVKSFFPAFHLQFPFLFGIREGWVPYTYLLLSLKKIAGGDNLLNPEQSEFGSAYE